MKLLLLASRNLLRAKGRTLLTVFGVASALALLVLVEALALGLDRALEESDAARTLIVYRKNRYCPQTSHLPEHYVPRIERVAGVEGVLPVRVFLNNCRASLDLVTFHGAPVDRLLEQRSLDVYDGDVQAFRDEGNAALVGRRFAERKGLVVGDSFRFGGIEVYVRGLYDAPRETDESLILTHLEFLQRAGVVGKLGTVTQFEVTLAPGSDSDRIAAEIDALFASAEEPTDTRPRSAHLTGATRDLQEILRFGRLLAMACVVVVLALVASTVMMNVQSRVRELGVLRTFGFGEGHVALLVMGEAVTLSLLGGVVGVGGAVVLLKVTSLSIGTEGVTVAFAAGPEVVVHGLVAAVVSGAVAGLAPAWRSARRPVVQSLSA